MNTIIVEKLGMVSLRSGIVYVQCLSGSGDGKDRVSGELAIPVNHFSLITNAFQSTGKNLTERIQEAMKDQKTTEEKKEEEAEVEKVVEGASSLN